MVKMIISCKLAPDITVGPVGAAELDHQPQLIYFPNRGKDRYHFVLKEVPSKSLVNSEHCTAAGISESCSSISLCPCQVWTQSSLAAVPRKSSALAFAGSRTRLPLAAPGAAWGEIFWGCIYFNIAHLDKSLSSTTKGGLCQRATLPLKPPVSESSISSKS